MMGRLDRRTVLGMGAAIAFTPAGARARPEARTLRVGDRLERFDWLKPGVKTYLRSMERGDQHIAVDIWRRETRLETVDGVERLRIVQRWDGADQPSVVTERDSVFELGTFRPLSHTRITTREDGRRVEAFRFADDGVFGLEGVANNDRAGFSQPSDEPMFNFETDTEMLQTLPLAAGYAVSIPFYHPGGGAPARYLWRVAAEDRLRGPDGDEIDCWVVETDYNAPQNPPSRFWMAKATQQFIKLEAQAPNGVIHRKTLLGL